MTGSSYVGDELALFGQARNWKSYVYSLLKPQLGASVLEVGAGIGMTAQAYCRGDHEEWVCLEPDPDQVAQMRELVSLGALPGYCRVVEGTIEQLPAEKRFDTILYIDVLEHIEDHEQEARRASKRLRAGGHLIVLSPAHQELFTPFDAAIGHHRRYTRASLQAVVPQHLIRVRLDYLDSVGLFASLANRLLLRQTMPTSSQIKTWDTLMVPISRITDPITFRRFGKSVMGIWRKPEDSGEF